MDQSNQIPPVTQPDKKSSVGPLIGIIIIIIVLIIGALYFWGARLNTINTTPDEVAPLSSSDKIEDISADLNATVISGFENDLSAIEMELE